MPQDTTSQTQAVAEGDLVEVVLRGKVSSSLDVGVFWIGNHPSQNRIKVGAEHVVSVTKVEPEWQAGDIVIVGGATDHPLTFSRTGEWRCTCKTSTTEPADMVSSAFQGGRVTLVIRGGQVVSS